MMTNLIVSLVFCPMLHAEIRPTEKNSVDNYLKQFSDPAKSVDQPVNQIILDLNARMTKVDEKIKAGLPAIVEGNQALTLAISNIDKFMSDLTVASAHLYTSERWTRGDQRKNLIDYCCALHFSPEMAKVYRRDQPVTRPQNLRDGSNKFPNKTPRGRGGS